MDWSRWQGWRGWRTWTVGAVAYHVFMLMPWCVARHCTWMLPWVGDYAYWDDAMAVMRSEQKSN